MTVGADPGSRRLQTPRLTPRLALADMRHDRVLTLCVVIALIAIISPLLILQGLRYGSVELLRSRLVDNPSYREIWPTATQSLSADWFDDMRERREVAFVIPTVLRGVSVVGVQEADSGKITTFDMISSAPGDPVLAAIELARLDDAEVAISESAREAIGVGTGETIVLSVDRIESGRIRRQTLSAKVAGVVPFEYDGLARVYVPADFARAVERYRRQLSVPEYGWPGGLGAPPRSFDGVYVLSRDALSPTKVTRLKISAGLSTAETIATSEVAQNLGVAVDPALSVLDMRVVGGAVYNRNLRELRASLIGTGAVVAPYVFPMEITVGGRQLALHGLSLSEADATVLGVEAPPWGADDPDETARGPYPVVGGGLQAGSLEASFTGAAGSVSFPVQASGGDGPALAPLDLLGTLRTGSEEPIEYHRQVSSFIAQDVVAKGFRLYTASIDDVPDLYRELVQGGMKVDAHIQDIEIIRVLDQGLMQLFLLIAVVGGLGGSGALIASLYAAVERKKRSLAILRLMGFSRRDVWFFPIYQGLALSILGGLGAVIVFWLTASLINTRLSGAVLGGGDLCYLPPLYILYAILFAMAAALLSALFAARAATAVEPAEALREE